MASSATFSTLVLSSSFATQCNVSNRHHQSCFLSSPPKIPIFSIPKPVSLKLTSLLSKTPTFFTIPKSSESDAAVVDVEPDNVEPEPEPEAAPEPEPEPASVVEASKEEPKREEIFAVVMIGGRQYIVFPGRYLYTQRLKGANVNDKVGDSDFFYVFLDPLVKFYLLQELLSLLKYMNSLHGQAWLKQACSRDVVCNVVLLLAFFNYMAYVVMHNLPVTMWRGEKGKQPKVVPNNWNILWLPLSWRGREMAMLLSFLVVLAFAYKFCSITVMEGTELVLGIWVLLIKIVIIDQIDFVSQIVLNKVLLVGTKTTTYIGKPVVTNAAVHAVVEEQGLNPKVVVFKYKKKKNYRRNIGHRQV
ncbi:hypothetical protein Goklo_011918 [Gossypium klotzschianum]|uniref:Ribosomal protein L21 n=1 Tax=Gossypium klotzschianum TaxID=34286 RepID=A0A7J8VAK7_9ROSI|nr:hypothetical protein [Gossypium klotzschianum]